MAFTPEQLAGLLFKKISAGKATASPSKQFFEEPRNARSFVAKDQIWAESDLIPPIAPASTSGVVERLVAEPLAPIPGSTASYAASGRALTDLIPFNWGDGTSYNYQIQDALGNVIPFGQGDWFLDTETGVLTFFGAVPANMPPTLSAWRYVGKKGLADPPVLSVNGRTGDVKTLDTLNGLSGSVEIGSLTGFLTMTTEASAGRIGLDLTRGSMVEAINGVGGMFSVVGGNGIDVSLVPDGGSGTMLVLSRVGASGGGTDHHHDGVDSPRVDYLNLLNRPVMVNRLADMDGTVDLVGTAGVMVQKDFDTNTLILASSGLATNTQLRTHTHDGVNSSRISFANLVDVPPMVNTLNGVQGNMVMLSADQHLRMVVPSGSPNTLEFSVSGFAPEVHDHDYVKGLNGLKGFPTIAGGDASILVQASGGQIFLFATGASGMYEGSGPPTPHAATHASGGSDPLTAEMIGAAPYDHVHPYAAVDHDHDSRYSLLGHTHDTVTRLQGLTGDLSFETRGGLALYPGGSGTLVLEATGGAFGPHAASHFANGDDPIHPIDIGAADRTHSHPHGQLDAVWDVNGYAKSLRLRPGYGIGIVASIDGTYPASGTTTDLWLSVTASAGPHAAQHAADGIDPLTPGMIGAASLGHTHDDRYAFSNHLHDDRYSQLTHLHDDRYSRLTHTHAVIQSLNGITGAIQVVGTRGIAASLAPAPSGSGYDYTLSIAATGSVGGGGAGNGQQWTDEFAASGNQTVFRLTKTVDLGIPLKVTVANVRQPQANYAYDLNTNSVVLQGWGTRQGDLVFIDYSYL